MTNNTWIKAKLHVYSLQTLLESFANNPRENRNFNVFRPIFRHFTKCAKIAKRKQNNILPDILSNRAPTKLIKIPSSAGYAIKLRELPYYISQKGLCLQRAACLYNVFRRIKEDNPHICRQRPIPMKPLMTKSIYGSDCLIGLFLNYN